MNKVNVNFFLPRSLVGNILEGDTVFITNIGVCVGAKNKQSSTGKQASIIDLCQGHFHFNVYKRHSPVLQTYLQSAAHSLFHIDDKNKVNCQVNFGLYQEIELKGISFGSNEEGSSILFLWNKGTCRGCVARGLLPACVPPLQLPPRPSVPLSWKQVLKHQGTSSHNPLESGSPLVLTVRVCSCVCVLATPAQEWHVLVGFSFNIWFATNFLVNFCSFFFSPLISCQSSSLL